MIINPSAHDNIKFCFRLPIPEIFQASKYLENAVKYHNNGEYEDARNCIASADIPEIWEWVESIIGKRSPYIQHTHNVAEVPALAKHERIPLRMPNNAEKQKIHDKYWYCCQFCGTPVIRPEIRNKIRTKYPDVLRWWKTNASRHNAFFALWAQYDHIIPYARGGDNSLDNMILTCTACNFWRMNYLLEEVGIILPRDIKICYNWNWLESFI